MELQHFLDGIDLGSYEKSIVVTLARDGSATATQLVRAAHVPQGRIYDTLQSLATKGVVVVTPSRPKQYRIADVKRALSGLLVRKKHALERQLAAIQRIDVSPPKRQRGHSLTFFTGKADRIRLHEEFRTRARKELLQMAPLFVGDFHSTRALLRALERGVRVRVILLRVTSQNKNTVLTALRAGATLRTLDTSDMVSCTLRDNEEFLLGAENYRNDEERLTLQGTNPALLNALRGEFERVWRKAVPVSTQKVFKERRRPKTHGSTA